MLVWSSSGFVEDCSFVFVEKGCVAVRDLLEHFFGEGIRILVGVIPKSQPAVRPFDLIAGAIPSYL